MNPHLQTLAKVLNINIKQISATLNLLGEGATVPFIARYRKEATGSLDEVQIAAIRDLAQQLQDLDKRREAILKSLVELDKLSDELKKQIEEKCKEYGLKIEQMEEFGKQIRQTQEMMTTITTGSQEFYSELEKYEVWKNDPLDNQFPW